jgi:hypothetical protein
MANSKKMVATSTYYTSMSDPRVPLAIRAIEAFATRGVRVVVVDESPRDFFRNELDLKLVDVFLPDTPGMGNCRRQAIRIGMEMVGPNGVGAFIEPEKIGMAPCLDVCFAPLFDGADIVVSGRTARSWASYPRTQQLSEPFGNHGFALATGREDLDMFHGPRFFNWKASRLFLESRPQLPGGDTWGTTHYPVLHALSLGYTVRGIPLDYRHPVEQKIEEESALFYAKRVKQIVDLTDGTFMYAKELGLMAQD